MSTFGFVSPVKKKEVKNLTFTHRELKPINEIQPHEFAAMVGDEVILDVECYPNYFLIALLHIKTGKAAIFEISPDSSIDCMKLAWCLYAFKTYTFNGNHYDMPLVYMALKGYGCKELKQASNRIIDEDWRVDDIYEAYNIVPPFMNHIDIMAVCPLKGTLKKYAGRLHAKRMQELPYDPYKDLSQEQALDIKNYCVHADCQNTLLLIENLREELKLREVMSAKYGIDLRSKSDAQMAEAVMKKELAKILGRDPKRPTLAEGYKCEYKDTGLITFHSPHLQKAYNDVLAAKFSLDNGGSPVWPVGLGVLEKNKQGKFVWGLKLKINETVYKIGMGGIHSQEKSIAHTSCAEYILLDRDVASYYPRIILNQKLFPKHLGAPFLLVYDGIVVARLTAKQAKDIIGANSLKIVINGGFGKFGSKWSIIYSPDLLLQVTISGQFFLLMLAERLELAGIRVVSANTDGLVSKVRRSDRHIFEAIVKQWEADTLFETEETGYQALYSKDVNNYIAVKYKEDKATEKLNYGKNWLDEKEVCKLKGAYANPWPDKKAQIFRFHVNPTFQICTEAICAFLLSGTPIEQTIRQCEDITKFVAVRDVKGGAHKDGQFVGKFIRWYSSIHVRGTINYVLSNNKVPETEGGKPCMDLPEQFPDDINYEWYVQRTKKMMVKIGYYKEDDLKGQRRFSF